MHDCSECFELMTRKNKSLVHTGNYNNKVIRFPCVQGLVFCDLLIRSIESCQIRAVSRDSRPPNQKCLTEIIVFDT